MFFIINAIAYMIWATYLCQKRKINLHTIIVIYSLSLLLIDIPEITFLTIKNLYKFHVKLLINPIIDSYLGIILSDGVILPLMAIIIYCYIKPNRVWRYILIFTGLHIALELLFLRFGYLKYNNWSIWYSATAYLIGTTVVSYTFLFFKLKSIPFWLRITSFSYPAFSWLGVIFNGLLEFYRLRPHIFENKDTDSMIGDLGITWVIVFINAIFISHVSYSIRKYLYFLGALSISIFYIWLKSKGISIYYHWNNLFMTLRWSIPFILMFLFDNWERKYYNNQKAYNKIIFNIPTEK